MGGLPKGNTGNILLTNQFRPTSIDMDIGIALIPFDDNAIDGMQKGFGQYANELKKKDYKRIIKAVLTSVSEGGAEVEEIKGKLATVPDAGKWISEGIDLVLKNVSALKGADLQEIFETWEDKSKAYANYLVDILKFLKD